MNWFKKKKEVTKEEYKPTSEEICKSITGLTVVKVEYLYQKYLEENPKIENTELTKLIFATQLGKKNRELRSKNEIAK